MTNEYDLTGRIRGATPYAKEALKAREERRKADAARRTRKGLRLVRTDDDEVDE